MSTPVGGLCPPGKPAKYGPALAFSIDSEKYGLTGVPTPLVMNFQWSTQTTSAQFRDSSTGLLQPEPIQSEVRYNGRRYTLESAQFTSPTHATWVIPATNQTRVQEEITLTFRTADTIIDENPNTIILVIPIIRDDNATVDPPFLKALANPNDLPGNVSPRDVIPNWQNNLYAYYTICAQGMATNDPPQYVQVIVFTRGLSVKPTLITQILTSMNSAQQTPKFGAYSPPLGLVLTSIVGDTIAESTFPIRVKHAYNLLEPQGIQPAATAIAKEVPTDAFKCVPLNPETDISNGKILIDTVTGETLTDVEKERVATKSAATSAVNFTAFANSLKGGLSIALAVAFVFLFFFIIFSGSGDIGVPGEELGAVRRLLIKLAELPIPLVVGFIAGFIGFAIGFFLK